MPLNSHGAVVLTWLMIQRRFSSFGLIAQVVNTSPVFPLILMREEKGRKNKNHISCQITAVNIL